MYKQQASDQETLEQERSTHGQLNEERQEQARHERLQQEWQEQERLERERQEQLERERQEQAELEREDKLERLDQARIRGAGNRSTQLGLDKLLTNSPYNTLLTSGHNGEGFQNEEN